LLRLLMVERSAEDASRAGLHLSDAGCRVAAVRVTTAEQMMEALKSRDWDVILAGNVTPDARPAARPAVTPDARLDATPDARPGFCAEEALEVLKRSGRDIPFIILTGVLNNEVAVALMRAGARDYLRKDDLSRLLPAIEREMREAAMRERNRKLEANLRLQAAALDSAANAMAITDREGTLQWVNPAFTKLTGYSAEEAIGKNPRVLKSGEHEDSFYREMWATIAAGSVWHGQVINRRKDGINYVEEMTITPVRAAVGEISHYIAVKEDVTARRRDERTLRESERKYKLLTESIDDLFCALDSELRFTFWNQKLAESTGISAEEALGKTRTELFGDTEFTRTADAMSRDAMRTGQSIHYETERLIRGDKRSFEMRLVPTGDGLTSIGRDVTERKLAELALIRSEKLASVGRMAATIAHEINNPLAAAINSIYLAKTDPALAASLKKTLEVAEQELGRVSHLTKQTLGFYREPGNPTAVDLVELFDDVLSLYGPRMKNKNISVECNYRSGTSIRANEGEIRQVASNVIANSIDALPQGGRLEVRLLGPIALWGQRRMVRITVADNGEGIPPANLKRVFEPFFTTKESVGTGLGLWVTSELVKRHDGKIRIRSKLGQGTVVTIWLPIERRAQERRIA